MSMFLDSHQHFWKYNPSEYSWINDRMKVLKRDYLPAELDKELLQLNINGTIAVQARQSLAETRWLLQLAEEYPFIKGVIGWVDLCSPDVRNQLEELVQNPKLVGVRHVVHDEPDDLFMARSDFQKGISLLSEFNLTYDLLIFPKHLPLAKKLVEKFPDQLFVLDHIAKPSIKEKMRSPWDKEIRLLAEQPNIYCKLSGMVTEADCHQWQSADFTYYLDVVFDCFGPDRLMIGSDWPVCTLAGDYSQVMLLVLDYLKQFVKTAKQKVSGENCAWVYGIG